MKNLCPFLIFWIMLPLMISCKDENLEPSSDEDISESPPFTSTFTKVSWDNEKNRNGVNCVHKGDRVFSKRTHHFDFFLRNQIMTTLRTINCIDFKQYNDLEARGFVVYRLTDRKISEPEIETQNQVLIKISVS